MKGPNEIMSPSIVVVSLSPSSVPKGIKVTSVIKNYYLLLNNFSGPEFT